MARPEKIGPRTGEQTTAADQKVIARKGIVPFSSNENPDGPQTPSCQPAEIAIQSECRKLRAILDAMADGVYIVNSRYEIEYVNPAMEKEFGPVKGRKCHAYLRGCDDPCLCCTNIDVFAGKTTQREWFMPETGKTYDLFATPLENADGSVSMLAIFHDITARRQAEHAARASEARYRLIADNVTDIIWTLRFAAPLDLSAAVAGDRIADAGKLLAGSRFTYISPSFERLLGYPAAEALNLGPLDLLAPSSLVAAQSAVQQEITARTFGSTTIELEHVAKDGSTRWCEVTASFFWNDEGQVAGLLGVTRDITDRRNLERELSEVSIRQRQQIGQELHDRLGQQLLGLGLMAKALQKSLQAHALPEADAAGELLAAVGEARNQVRLLLKGVRPVEVDADGMMAALQDMAESTRSLSGVSCAFLCNKPVPVEDNNIATGLFYIAREAVTNAVKHANATRIVIGLEADDRELRLWVRDDGVGQQRTDGPPAGMGLRIMQHRAALIGGALDIRPAEGGGTLVACTITQERQP